MNDTADDSEWQTRPFRDLRSLADFQGHAQHKGRTGYQETADFDGDAWSKGVRWCIDKSREPHVRYAALYCGGTPQRSWRDGELVWDVSRMTVASRCIHDNEHGEQEGRET